MIFRYGSYYHPDSECIVTFFGAARIYNSRGMAQIVRKRMVVEGEIIAANTTAIASRVTEIKNAYALDGGDAVLHGTASSFFLSSADSIGGTRVVEGPSFMAQDGKAHFATGLPFTVTIEADYLAGAGLADGLVSYSETITKVGTGGARAVTIELDNGPPVKQTVSSSTPIIVVQSGEAVGIASYPVPNAPLFISDIDDPNDIQISEGTPRFDNGTWLDYPVRWSYRFTLTSNAGIPHPLQR